jgi:uracil-DNA glycosylase family 4
VSFDNDDPSANFFRECFNSVELERRDVFITNACLCHPSYPGYTDTKPKVREIVNCHYWLERQLQIAKPALVVTLGAVAWQSILRYFGIWSRYKGRRFLEAVGEPIEIRKTILLPLAHTSRLGRVNRSPELQRADWQKIPQLLKTMESAT